MEQGLLVSILIWVSCFNFQAQASGPALMGDYDRSSFSLLRRLLTENSNEPFYDSDFASYQAKLSRFKNKVPVSFDQKDAILHTFLNLGPELRERLFASTDGTWKDVKVVVNRRAPATLVEVANNRDVPESVRLAAKISIYGTTHAPAIISDDFVTHVAGMSSAYSTLDAAKSIIYEAYRPTTYTSLIIGHEGFHSAMRRLGNLNRLNRLSQFVAVPVATGAKYSIELKQSIDQLATLSAHGLEDLHIDERFTSDHHGTIMAVIHHGIFQAMVDGDISNYELQVFDTDYPFNYIGIEKNWTGVEKRQAQFELASLNQKFIEDNQELRNSLREIESKLSLYTESSLLSGRLLHAGLQ